MTWYTSNQYASDWYQADWWKTTTPPAGVREGWYASGWYASNWYKDDWWGGAITTPTPTPTPTPDPGWGGGPMDLETRRLIQQAKILKIQKDDEEILMIVQAIWRTLH